MGPNDRWLIPYLEMIAARPGMYLGAGTVGALESYIKGHAAGRAAAGFPRYGDGEARLLDEFTTWLKQRVGHDTADLWRSAYIEMLDASDDNARTFCSLWKEFLGEKGVSITPDEVKRFAEQWKRL